MNTTTLQDAIIDILARGDYYLLDSNAERVQGSAISWLKKTLSFYGWRSLGSDYHFEKRVEALGFSIVSARSVRRNQAARIITL